jgi:hypothetical protein
MHLRALAFSILFPMLAILPSVEVAAAGDDRDVQIVLDPATMRDQNAAPVWLGYIMARAVYIDKHQGLYKGQKGTITPRFEEELKARDSAVQIYTELKEKDKSVSSPYFDDLTEIRKAGFLKEYVWTFLRQSTWSTPPTPDRLALFKEWMDRHLPNHKAETHGSIVVNG